VRNKKALTKTTNSIATTEFYTKEEEEEEEQTGLFKSLASAWNWCFFFLFSWGGVAENGEMGVFVVVLTEFLTCFQLFFNMFLRFPMCSSTCSQ